MLVKFFFRNLEKYHSYCPQRRLPVPEYLDNVVIDGYFMTESADDVFKKGQQASAVTENAKRTLEKFYRSISSFPAVSLRSKS